MEERIHIFEAGRRGKPDELDTIIANTIGAYFLELNRDARFDVRVAGTWDKNANRSGWTGGPVLRLSGEISDFILDRVDKDEIERACVEIYNQTNKANLKGMEIRFGFKEQYTNLARNSENKKSGDSGSPLAVALRHGPNYLPWERFIAVGLRDVIDKIYQNNGEVPSHLAEMSGVKSLEGLRADGKVQVGIMYRGNSGAREYVSVDHVVIAAEHEESLGLNELREKISKIAQAYIRTLELGTEFAEDEERLVINGADAWNKGGWEVDEGSREAKPYRDGFGTWGICEDSFSGEDPSKVSATGTMIARYIAVQAVSNRFADIAIVTPTYAIGRDKPRLNIFTGRGGFMDQRELTDRMQTFAYSIQTGTEKFDLRNPETLRGIVQASDYFHKSEFAWNKVIRL